MRVFALLLLLSSDAPAVEIYFTPGTACEDRIVAAITGAREELVAAVYSINNPRIVAALREAHGRGVKVRVLTDRTQAAGQSSKVLELADAGVPVRVHSKHKIEHNKFLVVDKTVAINGSYNWTKPASAVNSENCAVMPEANAVAAFRKRFDELWKLNAEERSLVFLAKIRKKRAPAARE